jgi:hypothetical protein
MDKATDAGKAWRTLLGVAILMAASQAALAAPVTLICTPVFNVVITIDLNEAAHTVTINNLASYDSATTPPTVIPASSSGPIAAKFDSKMITFAQHFAKFGTYENWTLDRRTGELLEYRGVNAPYDRATSRNVFKRTCHVEKTKF